MHCSADTPRDPARLSSYPVLLLLCSPLFSTLFPYTTLFRSDGSGRRPSRRASRGARGADRRAPPDSVRGPTSGRACAPTDRKSTRLNSSHLGTSYAVFCLKKNPDSRKCTVLRIPLATQPDYPVILFFSYCVVLCSLHSFPTRRSSDLMAQVGVHHEEPVVAREAQTVEHRRTQSAVRRPDEHAHPQIGRAHV